jgi:15-cis-phytoene synthase
MSTYAETKMAHPALSAALAQQQAEQVIRAHSKTFFFATALLPRNARHGIRALYGFCRSTDDLVDSAESGCAGIAELEIWRAQTALEDHGQTNPILFAWAQVRRAYQVNRQYEQELIDGVARDLQFVPYPTWESLQQYCYQVASTVGLLSMPIIGLAKGATFAQAAPFAIQLGIALQLTNILRDVGEDARRGRVYFPLEDLHRFGLTLEDIRNELYNDNFIALMRFEIERARQLYRQALPGIRLLNPSVRPAVGAAALLYRAILDEIEQIDYRVYQIRAHTSGLKKLAMLPGIFATIWTLKDPI